MKKLFLPLLLSSLFIHTLAQEKQPSLRDTINIKEVIVTGSVAGINRNNTPLSVSVLDRRQIAEGNESTILPMLNGRIPGLYVTERGVTGFGVAAGSAGQISIRGVGGNPTTGVLVLIDGHPQFMGIMGHPLADSYVSSDVERVEVIRGPASLLYGSNAMGGVINIITRKSGEEGSGGNARISYGSFNTWKQAASAGVRKKGFSVYASVNHDKTDGHRPNSDFDIVNGYLKLGYDISRYLKAGADLSLAQFNATDPGPDTLKALPGNHLDILRGYGAISLSNESDKLSGALKLYSNFGEHTISDGFHSRDKNYGLNLYEALRLSDITRLSFGADVASYGGKAENTKALNGKGITFADTTVREAGAYVFLQQTVLQNLNLTGGLRLQNHSKYGNEWIPSAGFAWQLTPLTTWRAGFSKGFRSPTIRELYMFNHNPNLRPERVYNYETGIAQAFAGSKYRLEVTLYLLKGDNMIVTGAMGNLFNTGKINNKGTEIALTGRPLKELELQLTYSFISMESPLFATPGRNLFLGGTWNFGKARVNLSFRHIGDLNNNATGKANLVGYNLLNARTTWSICRYADFSLSAENLLGEKYEPNHYYPMPLTTLFAGLNIRFGNMH